MIKQKLNHIFYKKTDEPFIVIKKSILLYYCCIVIGVTVIALIPFADFQGAVGIRILSYSLSALIWLIFAGEILITYVASKSRRTLESGGQLHKKIKRGPVGVFAFVKNKEAFFADVVLFVSTVLIVLLAVFKVSSRIINIFVLILLFVSFNLHCVLNGRNYRYYKYFNKCKNEEKEEKKNESK